ncbi:MAG: DUF4145 domain-containing protein [Bryobacteraceae bacterium]|jgi:hypothetical protein
MLRRLAWPTAALAIAVMFRKDIRSILARIRKAALPGGVAIDFEDEVRETKELATRIESAPSPHDRPKAAVLALTEANARMIDLGLKPIPSGLDMSYYKEIAVRDPALALAGLRIELEILIKNLAKGSGIDFSPRDSPTRILWSLRDASKITPEQFELAQRIVSLANQAIHGRTVSRTEADEIIDAARALVDDYLAWLSWGFKDGWVPPHPGIQRTSASLLTTRRLPWLFYGYGADLRDP